MSILFVVSASLALLALGGFLVTMIYKSLARHWDSGRNSRIMSELGLYLSARNSQVWKIDETVNGCRYLGAGSALLLQQRISLTGSHAASQPVEALYRTTDNLHFIFKGSFFADGLNSDLKESCIVPMSLSQAKYWAVSHSNGLDLSLTFRGDMAIMATAENFE